MLIEHAYAMHYAADLPKFLWPESVQHAVWLKNCMSTYKLDGKMPFELVFNKKTGSKQPTQMGSKGLDPKIRLWEA